ncbi:hypothetical protein VNO78_28137 [Psophocarpus tetragonolobus]|uniref:Uncharacterized protein n=1 Tax=Psophocarpus tetragonolobus TaxID=3891 RepID=A0AAN9S1I3_PSOTE
MLGDIEVYAMFPHLAKLLAGHKGDSFRNFLGFQLADKALQTQNMFYQQLLGFSLNDNNSLSDFPLLS